MKGQLSHEVITLPSAHKDTPSNYIAVQRASSFPKRFGLREAMGDQQDHQKALEKSLEDWN